MGALDGSVINDALISRPNAMGVYAIRNLVTGKLYIGSAVNFRRRFNAHRLRLKNGNHHSVRLQSSWNKHGEAAFSFEVLEVVLDRSLLLSVEQMLLDEHQSYGPNGYNVFSHAGSSLGYKPSVEAIEKTASALRGRKRSRELVERLAAMKRGTKHTEEAKEKMRDAHTGVPLGAMHRANLRASLSGRKLSESHIAKISERMKGNKYGLGNTVRSGSKASAETRAKMSASHMGHRAWNKGLRGGA